MTPLRERMLEDMQIPQSVSTDTGRLRRARRPVRAALWALAGGLGPGGAAHLSGLLDSGATPRAQFARDRAHGSRGYRDDPRRAAPSPLCRVERSPSSA